MIHSCKVSKFIFCGFPWCWAHRHRFWPFCSSTCCLLRKSLQLLLQRHPNWSYLGTKPRDSQRGSIPLSTCKCSQRKCWAFWEETMLWQKLLFLVSVVCDTWSLLHILNLTIFHLDTERKLRHSHTGNRGNPVKWDKVELLICYNNGCFLKETRAGIWLLFEPDVFFFFSQFFPVQLLCCGSWQHWCKREKKSSGPPVRRWLGSGTSSRRLNKRLSSHRGAGDGWEGWGTGDNNTTILQWQDKLFIFVFLLVMVPFDWTFVISISAAWEMVLFPKVRKNIYKFSSFSKSGRMKIFF